MTDDIVTRLRAIPHFSTDLSQQAADEIERLRTELQDAQSFAQVNAMNFADWQDAQDEATRLREAVTDALNILRSGSIPLGVTVEMQQSALMRQARMALDAALSPTPPNDGSEQ